MTDQDLLTEVSRLNRQRAIALTEADLETLGEMLDDDLLYVHSSGGYDTKESLLGKLGDRLLVYRSAEIVVERAFTHDGTIVIAVEHIRADVMTGERAIGVDSTATSVWVRHPAGLRLLALPSVSRERDLHH